MQRISEEWEASRVADIDRQIAEAETEARRSTTEDAEMVRQFFVMAPNLVEEEWRKTGRKISDDEAIANAKANFVQKFVALAEKEALEMWEKRREEREIHCTLPPS